MRLIAAACALLCALVLAQPAKASWFGNPAVSKSCGPKPRASCGWHMRMVFGCGYGPEFNLARSWAALPKTTPRPGAVVVSKRKGHCGNGWCGHVVKIKAIISKCVALVTDNRGTYERDICKNRVAVVQPRQATRFSWQ